MRHIEASVVAQNTGADLLLSSFDQFVDPLRIRKELSCKSRAVNAASGDRVRCCHRIHSSGADNRNIHKFSDVLHILQVAVLGHVDRRVRPVPCIIGSVVAVEHVVTGVLKIFCRPLGLLHIAPCFLELLAGKRAAAESLRLGDHAVTQGHREIISAGLLDRLNDLHREAVAVLERSAVFICAMIHILECELIEQVAFMNRMDLHAVHARFLEEPCALGERIHKLMDLFHRHRSGGNFVRPAVGCGRCASRYLIQVHERL